MTTTHHALMDMIHTASQSGKQEKEEKNEGMSTEDRVFWVFFFTSWIITRETHEIYLSSVLSLLSAPSSTIDLFVSLKPEVVKKLII